jgi:predicted Zn-dependent protease
MIKYGIFSLLILSSLVAASQDNKAQHKGAKTFELIRQSSGIYHHPELLSVVTEVGRNLEKHLQLSYELKYFLVDTDSPNAFATDGGYVYVTRGLLALLNSKDELAGVMGHELSHVTERHVPKRTHASILPTVLELPADIIGLLTYNEVGQILNLPIDLVADLALDMYSRNQENDADILGVQLAAKAGYNPNGLANALVRLTAYVELVSGHEMKNSIFSDHPMTENRVANIREIIKKNGLVGSQLQPFTDIEALENLVYGQNPDGGIVSGSVFIHPGIGLYCELPDKWKIRNSVASLVAIAENNKDNIILSLDSTSESVEHSAKKSISRLRNCHILTQDSAKVNGLEAYRVTLKNIKIKYADQLIEMMWLKMPNSNTILKVVGITNFNHPEQSIENCFSSFRQLNSDDLERYAYTTVKLIEPSQYSSIQDYTKRNITAPSALLEVLNGAGAKESLISGRFMKVLISNDLK